MGLPGPFGSTSGPGINKHCSTCAYATLKCLGSPKHHAVLVPCFFFFLGGWVGGGGGEGHGLGLFRV